MRRAPAFVEVLLVTVVVGLLAPACGKSPAQPSPQPTPPIVTPGPTGPDPGPVEPGPSTPPTPTPPAPRLTRTRIVAFGDSITEGVVSNAAYQLLIDVPGSYPQRLRTELSTRYRDQTIEVLNEGRSGEWAEAGVARFPDVIRQDAPEIIILMEGANDLGFLGRKGISATIGQLETMVKYARARGIPILLASLPPQREGSPKGASASFLAEFNRQVRGTAVDEGAIFVDVFAGFGSDAGLIGADGLHPTPEGYARMTQIFMDAIRANFEAAPATGTRPVTTNQ
jgi:lysophospholipase L1-like esterase